MKAKGFCKGTDLDSDNLNGLVPCRERTADRAGQDLVHGTEPVSLLDALDVPQALLGETGETHSASPVGRLTERDGVDTLVDTGDTLSAVNVHEHLEGALGRGAGLDLLVSRDLDRLHARAET